MPANAPTAEDVMAELAVRLRRAVGEEGVLARVRADGFAILVNRVLPEREVIGIAERCVDAVRSVSGWRGVEASAAVGVAFARDLEESDPRVLMSPGRSPTASTCAVTARTRNPNSSRR